MVLEENQIYCVKIIRLSLDVQAWVRRCLIIKILGWVNRAQNVIFKCNVGLREKSENSSRFHRVLESYFRNVDILIIIFPWNYCISMNLFGGIIYKVSDKKIMRYLSRDLFSFALCAADHFCMRWQFHHQECSTRGFCACVFRGLICTRPMRVKQPWRANQKKGFVASLIWHKQEMRRKYM